MITKGHYYDCFKMRQDHSLYEIVAIQASQDTRVITLSNELYLKYANNTDREKDNVLSILREKVCGIEHYT